MLIIMNDTPDNSRIVLLLERIKEAIWKRRPILGKIMRSHGNDKLYNYARGFIDINKTPVLDARKHELIDVAEDLIARRLGSEVGEKVARQLVKFPLVSTADHHGPIDHPLWVNANIISALPQLENNDPDNKYLIVFSFSSVSVNNHTFPRGMLFHGGDNCNGELIRLPILPDRDKMGIVYAMRGMTRDDIEKAKATVLNKERDGAISPGRGTRINSIIDTYFGNSDVLGATSLAEQITKINYHLWPHLFHPPEGTHREDQGARIPELIYLEIETLVTQLLLRYHLSHPDSLIYKFLFDPAYQERIAVLFSNIPGAFSNEHNWGTYLFWAIDDKMHRVRMFLDNRILHSTYGRHVCDMTPEGIRAALLNKEIFPSMALCYLVVSLYYGMKCLGGFCQVHDLTMTKMAWQQLLAEMDEMDEADAINPVQTKELGGDGMVLSYLPNEQEELVGATGIDMLLEKPDTSLEWYVELSKRVTLNEMMTPILPEIYAVLYPVVDRDPELASLTTEGLIHYTQLKEKLTEIEPL